VPNLNRQTIALREILEAPEFVNSPSKLTLAMDGLHGAFASRTCGHAALADRGFDRDRKERVHQLADDVDLYKASPDEVNWCWLIRRGWKLNLYEIFRT